MARPIRIQYPGAVYHVMARVNQGREVLRDNSPRKVLLASLGEVCPKAGWRTLAQAPAAKHYHLLLQTPEPSLAEGTRWLQASCT